MPPTDLPDRKPDVAAEEDARSRVSGKLVVILILIWTAVLASWAYYASHSGLANEVKASRDAAHGLAPAPPPAASDH